MKITREAFLKSHGQQYIIVDRNIRERNGRFSVLLTRRDGSIGGGTHDTLAEAVAVRDKLEAAHPPRKPWGIKIDSGVPRRTMAQLRAERRAAGLCAACGDEPPTPGMASCRSCREAINQWRRMRRAEGAY